MMWEYETKQGDTWDVLARDIYGSEMLAYLILQANPAYMEMIYLPSGLKLTIPDTPPQKTNQPMPPWAREANGIA
jgi:phage tail protein X